jgi:hypothetical protein
MFSIPDAMPAANQMALFLPERFLRQIIHSHPLDARELVALAQIDRLRR